ncbi:MAG: hypothetical protein KF784_11910 [Fimbriimonadaceae bacterium]|nr:hypothetical protein [Fimbriimonadaceae bacterium]
MRVVQYYSHLNGYEHIVVHKPHLWEEIERVISLVDAHSLRTKISNEKGMVGKALFDPKAMNSEFKRLLVERQWRESRTSYFVTSDHVLIRQTMTMSKEEQKREIERAGLNPIYSYNQTDFVKERVEIEVQFGKYFSVAYDLFVKHMAFFIGDVIDVGVEIVPMKELQVEMSSGVPYYEGELYNLLRQGRSTPAVPLVMIGIAP